MSTLAVPNALTPHDLLKRRDYITATDAAKIMGSSSWGGPYDVWLEKCVEMEPVKQTPAMMWGNLLEDDIIYFTRLTLAEYLEEPSLKVTRIGTRRVHPNKVLSCTLDAVIQGRPDIIEAKTHATNHPNVNLDEWGDEWSDCVPKGYLDQCLAQLACCPEKERVWLVLSVGKAAPMIYCIERANHLARIADIENACCDFWDKYILTGTPPPDCGPTAETVKRARVPIDPGRIVTVDDVLLERSKALGSQKYQLEKDKEAVDARIKAALLGASEGRSPRGHMVSISQVNRKGFTVEATTYSKLNIKLVQGT